MYQIRLFGKADQYKDISSQDYKDDTRDQWSAIFEINGHATYKEVDSITVKCKTVFKTGDNVLVAYGENIIMFGYVQRVQTIVAGAQYEYTIVEYLQMLGKYPVPRFGTTTYQQIIDATISMKSRLDNFSYPGGKKRLFEIMDSIMIGAGEKWSHKVVDYYYDNRMAKCELDIDGPYYRWGGLSLGSVFGTEYMKQRWYDIPNFTQITGAYGQLPTVPNVEMKVNGQQLVKQITDPDDPDEYWEQVCYIPWTPDENDPAPLQSLLDYKRSIVNFIPTMDLCATTVLAAIKRLLIDLFKMNVWVEAKYKASSKNSDGKFVFEPPEELEKETIDDVTFVVCYGYVRDQKIVSTLQYIQFRSDEDATDKDIECVLVLGRDRDKDVGMAVKPGSTVPYKTAIWEYDDGRNEKELDALAKQVLADYQVSKMAFEVDLPPGVPWYEGEYEVHVGDIIRIAHDSFEQYHKENGWYEESRGRYTDRMNALCNMGFLSGERNEVLMMVKGIKYSITGTILELTESKGNIFDIMGEKLRRIEGTSQQYDVDYWGLKKADIAFSGRSNSTEYAFTNTDPTSVDYGNVVLTANLPSMPTGVPNTFKMWDGMKWEDGKSYNTDKYPAWTSLWLLIQNEDDMSDIPDDRGIVPIGYMGPWFNFEVQVLGTKPTLSQTIASSNLDYNNPACGSAWVIPYKYGSFEASSVWSTEAELKALEAKGQYVFPDSKCGLSGRMYKNIYFESETDCTVAPEMLEEVFTSGQAGVGCMNYLKIGPIPKGFDAISVTAHISFFDMVMAEGGGDTANTLDANMSYWGHNAKACLTFNFQWCLDVSKRPRNAYWDSTARTHKYGGYNGTSWVDNVWDSNPKSIYGGKWTSEMLTPTWTSSYATQKATLHSALSISSKRLTTIVEDASLYLRYVVVFNSKRQYASYMYNFLGCAGWSVSVTCTPGYELLDEWYKVRSHKIQLLIDGCGEWDDGSGNAAKRMASIIIDYPDDEFINTDGYFCFDIRKFIGEGNNYVRMRSVKEIAAGVFAPAELKVRGSYISGWLKD